MRISEQNVYTFPGIRENEGNKVFLPTPQKLVFTEDINYSLCIRKAHKQTAQSCDKIVMR